VSSSESLSISASGECEGFREGILEISHNLKIAGYMYVEESEKECDRGYHISLIE
jgi:hypothetical protein